MERHKKAVVGPIRAAPCPWCGQKNDFRELHEQIPMEAGHVVDCDHCQRKSVVVAVDRDPRLILRQKHT